MIIVGVYRGEILSSLDQSRTVSLLVHRNFKLKASRFITSHKHTRAEIAGVLQSWMIFTTSEDSCKARAVHTECKLTPDA